MVPTNSHDSVPKAFILLPSQRENISLNQTTRYAAVTPQRKLQHFSLLSQPKMERAGID